MRADENMLMPTAHALQGLLNGTSVIYMNVNAKNRKRKSQKYFLTGLPTNLNLNNNNTPFHMNL